MTLYFSNLFEEKDLNEGYGREKREKWKEVSHLIMLRYKDSYVRSYRAVFDNFLSKVALSSRFDGI
jgi:hypothetical protein